MTQLKTLILTLLVLLTVANADSWAPPKKAQYYSPNHLYRFTVNPGTPPTGTLERIQNDSAEEIWKRDLINPLAPATALVDDRGKAVVTFDDWAAVGVTERALVVYGPEGGLLKNYSVEELFSPDAVSKFVRTVSSRWWRREAWIDPMDDELILWTTVGRGEEGGELSAVSLITGDVRPADDMEVRRVLERMGEEAPISALDRAILKGWSVDSISSFPARDMEIFRRVRVIVILSRQGNQEALKMVNGWRENPDGDPEAEYYRKVVKP